MAEYPDLYEDKTSFVRWQHSSHATFNTLKKDINGKIFYYPEKEIELPQKEWIWYLKKNEEKHFELYLKSVEKGTLVACVDKDYQKAFKWKAVECCDISGQYEVRKCFYEGWVTEKDIIDAVYWPIKTKRKWHNNVNINNLRMDSFQEIVEDGFELSPYFATENGKFLST
ncbi:5821_t:CDS:2 [Diversispora eburnea]|uniref:5821_t:CDS:1 n=1 Tax=Diversispora eburnea TaxID=1213867 RepID=A0A9N8ZGY3_9GLOM|nr:5821_t:CDS:2 [Diversispora eburnea]